jgi:hypothetical protein
MKTYEEIKDFSTDLRNYLDGKEHDLGFREYRKWFGEILELYGMKPQGRGRKSRWKITADILARSAEIVYGPFDPPIEDSALDDRYRALWVFEQAPVTWSVDPCNLIQICTTGQNFEFLKKHLPFVRECGAALIWLIYQECRLIDEPVELERVKKNRKVM